MQTAIVFDCEFLVTENAQRRYWCGPYDPDPIIVQIGAVKISLNGDFEIVETLKTYITPVDRHGTQYELDPFSRSSRVSHQKRLILRVFLCWMPITSFVVSQVTQSSGHGVKTN
jgi:hypothetical protein